MTDHLSDTADVMPVATQLEKPICAVAPKVEKPVYAYAVATKMEKPVYAIEIDEPDFCASFDVSEKAWTVTWKWSDDAEPHAMRNRVSEYSIPTSARLSYEAEIEEWITNGWLAPYDDEKLGPAKGLIPLMCLPRCWRRTKLSTAPLRLTSMTFS